MPGDDRFQLALSLFQRALARLHEALALPEDDFIRDALIQRFEFTFEAGWRAAYRWLRQRDVDVSESAFDVLPEAFKHRLVADEAGWSRLRKYRNLTSHTYNENTAIEVAAFIRVDGVRLLAALLAELEARAHG